MYRYILLLHVLGATIWTGGLPKLRDDNVQKMVPHIVSVTTLGVLFVVAGVGFRVGGWS